jgi:hypothetical protein
VGGELRFPVGFFSLPRSVEVVSDLRCLSVEVVVVLEPAMEAPRPSRSWNGTSVCVSSIVLSRQSRLSQQTVCLCVRQAQVRQVVSHSTIHLG